MPYNYEMAKIKAPDSLNLKQPFFTNKQAIEKVSNFRNTAVTFWAKRFLTNLATDEEADAYQTLLNRELQKSTVMDTSVLPKVEAGGGFYVQLMTVLSFKFTKNSRPNITGCPILLLILKGQYDNQPWGFTQKYLDLFPNHKLMIIEGVGHSITLEKPKEYISEIRQFLSDSKIAMITP